MEPYGNKSRKERQIPHAPILAVAAIDPNLEAPLQVIHEDEFPLDRRR